MRFILMIGICLLCSLFKAQDKLYFVNGKIKQGIVVSMGAEFIFFRNTDTSAVQRIKRNELVMIENYKGVRYLLAPAEGITDSLIFKHPKVSGKRNMFGAQPLGILLGRATFVYEHLNQRGNIGFVIPVSLTFDPIGSLYKNTDTGSKALKHISGINFISGADINFYLGESEYTRFFIGPRFRYGTDVFLRNLEGYSLQTQFGWKIGDPGGKSVQHFSVGFGFARIVTAASSRVANPKHSYGWFSINYRIGFKW